mgnify:CR=1 FL=1
MTSFVASTARRVAKAWVLSSLLAFSAGTMAMVVTALPKVGSPDWNEVVQPGASMVASSGVVTMTTANYRGVWFGNHPAASDADPSWTLGTSSQGNWLSMAAAFSSGASDWMAFVADGSHLARIEFLDTGCKTAVACYTSPAPFQGVRVMYKDASQAEAQYHDVAIADMTQFHTYEFLLKNGVVSYRVDGNVVFSGAAWNSSATSLLIGDETGVTPSGTGAMVVRAVRMDTAPVNDVLVSAVPEPASILMALAGLAVCGFFGRRRL